MNVGECTLFHQVQGEEDKQISRAMFVFAPWYQRVLKRPTRFVPGPGTQPRIGMPK